MENSVQIQLLGSRLLLSRSGTN